MTPEEHHRAWSCIGSVHTLPIPAGMTVDDVVAELAAMGRLEHSDPNPRWQTGIMCPGGPDCWCLTITCAPGYTHHHNDIQVYP